MKDEAHSLIQLTYPETANELKPLGLEIEQFENLIATVFYRIVQKFNAEFGQRLKPLTLRDLKSTLKFLVYNL